MALHALTPERRHRAAQDWVNRTGILRLGAPHFLLLFAILMGLLALIALVFLVQLSSA